MKRNSDLLYIDHIVRWSLHYGPTVPAHTVCTLKENKQTEPVIRFHFIKEIYFAEMLLLYFHWRWYKQAVTVSVFWRLSHRQDLRLKAESVMVSQNWQTTICPVKGSVSKIYTCLLILSAQMTDHSLNFFSPFLSTYLLTFSPLLSCFSQDETTCQEIQLNESF